MMIKNKHVTACTLNDIVEHVIYSDEYKALVKKITSYHQHWEDLQQEFAIYFLTSEHKLEFYQDLLMKEQFKYYYVNAIKNQYNSNRSDFALKYLKHARNSVEIQFDIDDKDYERQEKIEFEDNQTRLLNEVKREVDKMDWYNREIWNLYHQPGYTLKKISEETGIKMSSLHSTIRKIRKELKKKIKK